MTTENECHKETQPEAQLVDETTAAQALRERIYASLTGIATVAILLGYAEETSPVSAAASLAVTMGGLWGASIVADLVAHPAVHGDAPSASHWHRIIYVAGQALEIALVPVAAVALAGTGIWTVHTGLVIAEVALVVTLVAAALWAGAALDHRRREADGDRGRRAGARRARHPHQAAGALMANRRVGPSPADCCPASPCCAPTIAAGRR